MGQEWQRVERDTVEQPTSLKDVLTKSKSVVSEQSRLGLSKRDTGHKIF